MKEIEKSSITGPLKRKCLTVEYNMHSMQYYIIPKKSHIIHLTTFSETLSSYHTDAQGKHELHKQLS